MFGISETLEAAKLKREADEEFDNNDWQAFRDYKESQPKWTLSVKEGQFWSDNENPESILNELNDNLDADNNEEAENEALKDSEFYPILKTLHQENHINDEVFNNLKLNKEDGKNEFLKIVNNISDESVKNNILKSFNNKEKVTEENFEKTEFYKDSSSLEIDLKNWIWWLEIMLSENYISIPNVEWNDDKQNDLSTCMDTTLNKLLLNSSDDFKKQNAELIIDIKKEKNLDKKYQLLKDLYKEDLKRDAILWWSKWKKEIEMNKKSLISKAEKINRMIIEANKIQDIDKKNTELDKLNIEKQKIIDEWKWIDNFEAEIQSLSWWKDDKQAEWNEKEPMN